MELTMLLDNGVDLHSYQPTTADLAKVSDCDLFIYVGGESDAWVDGALKEALQQEVPICRRYTKRFSEQERNSQDEYPKDETEIEVIGTFETYKESEDDMLYGHLVNSKLQIK